MGSRYLVTGGAGFIGRYLSEALLERGHQVRVLDSLVEQVHGASPAAPLQADTEFVRADMRDAGAVRAALRGVDGVFHLAAEVGVGQSMYEITRYTGANDLGTAVLLEAMIEVPVERLVVASSMSVYGEGLYLDAHGHKVTISERSPERLKAGLWEPASGNGGDLTPIPTPETKTPSLASVYALNKYAQERMCLLVGQAYGIPTVGLRFFNVYGTRQALSNPYTGVLAIFASRLLNDRPPMIFEDGLQRRNFVHVRDVARCCVLALESRRSGGQVFNVSNDEEITVHEAAARLAAALGKPRLLPTVTGKFRVGDIRHCFADITLARELLGYRPDVALDDGLAELVGWLGGQIAVDRVETMQRELASRGLSA